MRRTTRMSFNILNTRMNLNVLARSLSSSSLKEKGNWRGAKYVREVVK